MNLSKECVYRYDSSEIKETGYKASHDLLTTSSEKQKAEDLETFAQFTSSFGQRSKDAEVTSDYSDSDTDSTDTDLTLSAGSLTYTNPNLTSSDIKPSLTSPSTDTEATSSILKDW